MLSLRDNKDCEYELPASLDEHHMIKLAIDSCERCVIVVHTMLITGTVEIS